MKNALIIFVRHPELGKVKTRLAASIGDEGALHVYKLLLAHTLDVSSATDADKFIFYTEGVVANDMWLKDRYFKCSQAGGDLGNRMLNAFQTVLSKGYEKAIIIGSDCFELNTSIVEEGFKELENHDVVIGPANDGGYYLLGMKAIHKQLFENKKWSTETVYRDTEQTIKELHLSPHILPTLNDVDEEKDVPLEWLTKAL